MSVVVIGLNHRTVPLELLERMTIDAASLAKAVGDVVSRPNVSEAVVLSTCNRTEVYVMAERFHGAFHDVRQFLAEQSFLPPERFADHLYVHYDAECVRHLFEVTSGLDSAVVGEAEILGQVRTSWECSREERCSGPGLDLLFRSAVEVGKRVRTDTGIGRHVASVSSAAVAMAAEHLGSLAGRSILVLGAGEMGEGMVRALVSSGVADVRIANRTWERSEELAAQLGGTPVRLADLTESLSQVDLLLTGTGASSLMLEHGDLTRVMAARSGAELLVVDVAVPRDVDPTAAEVAGVTLLDMDDLRAFADAGLDARRAEVANVRVILDEALERYRNRSSARQVAPLVGSLHERGELVRCGELERLAGRLASLDDRQREAVEALTRGIVGKLLHNPTVAIKEASGTPKGERLADALRELHDL